MQAFLWAIVGNTLFAALLAAMVWLASGLLRRRPALVHALWILVLLKLVTPPLFDASVLFPPENPPRTRTSSHATEVAPPISVSETIAENIAIMEAQLEQARLDQLAHANRPWWPTLLLAVWATGSIGFLSISLYRATRFGWLVHSAPLADWKLTLVAEEQAARLGLSYVPTMKVVTACISPLVWQTPGGTTIVLPQKLVGELGPDQLRLLLAHELAHVHRGDPLVRWFALGVLTLHWWNPIVWLAVRQIEAAQEACCDSLVLSASGASPKRYAEMLLTTVDFLAGQETPPPALAAGFTSGSSLKGRCEMILSKRTPFALRPAARWMLAVLGLAILPLSTPLFGQDEKKPTGDELSARVERIEKALEELKAMLGNRASEEKVLHDKLQAANQELAAKMKAMRDDEAALRGKMDEARAVAERDRAVTQEKLAMAMESQAIEKAKIADLHDKIHSDIHAKVHADAARVQEEIAKASKQHAEAAAKMAKELAKVHGDKAAKYAEKMSADIAENVKSHIEQAQKYAEKHGEHAEKHAEAIARDIENQAEKIARDVEKHAEAFAKDAEKFSKDAVEIELPKMKEHLARVQEQMKLEAENLAKVAEDMSKNPELKKELAEVKEKMGKLTEHLQSVKEKELGKLKELKERKIKRDSSSSDVREEKAKDEGSKAERRAIEEQLRDRENKIRDLQREVEKLRKELGGGEKKRIEERLKRSSDLREVPVLSKVPYISRLFRNKSADEKIDELEGIEVELDLDGAMDIEIVDEVQEPDEVEEVEMLHEDSIIERKLQSEIKEPLPAIEILKRERLREDRLEKKSADAPVKP